MQNSDRDSYLKFLMSNARYRKQLSYSGINSSGSPVRSGCTCNTRGYQPQNSYTSGLSHSRPHTSNYYPNYDMRAKNVPLSHSRNKIGYQKPASHQNIVDPSMQLNTYDYESFMQKPSQQSVKSVRSRDSSPNTSRSRETVVKKHKQQEKSKSKVSLREPTDKMSFHSAVIQDQDLGSQLPYYIVPVLYVPQKVIDRPMSEIASMIKSEQTTAKYGPPSSTTYPNPVFYGSYPPTQQYSVPQQEPPAPEVAKNTRSITFNTNEGVNDGTQTSMMCISVSDKDKEYITQGAGTVFTVAPEKEPVRKRSCLRTRSKSAD